MLGRRSVDDPGEFGIFDIIRGFGRGMRLVRLAILMVFGIPILMCVGVGMFYVWMFGNGDVNVLAGADPTKVYVDGKFLADVPANGHHKFDVPQGKHTIKFESASGTVEQAVDVGSGLDRKFVGAGKDACYAELDVTEFYFEGGVHALPTVYKRFHGDEDVDLRANTVYAEDELPAKLDDHEHEYMMFSVPCESLALDDPSLVANLGYTL